MELGIKLENGNARTIAYRKPLFRKRIGVSFKPIVTAKSLEDGLADLIRVAQNDEQEACWLYVHDDSKWYNFASESIDEIAGDVHSVGVVQGFMPLYLKNKRKTHYHTHPKRVLEQETEKALKYLRVLHPEWDNTSMAIANEFFKKSHYMNSIFPSGKDIDSYVQMVQLEEGNGLDFGIVSPEFITQIELDAAAISPETEQKYRELYEPLQHSLFKEFSGEIWINTPIRKLAEETCKRLNTIHGLSIKIREHQ